MGVNHTILNIDLVLTKTRILAEKLQYVETVNLSEGELETEWEDIKHLSNQLGQYVPYFKEPSCDKCYNSSSCFKNRTPDYRCFEIITLKQN